MFEPDTSSMNSLEELESCQKQIEDILSTVTERKVSGCKANIPKAINLDVTNLLILFNLSFLL